MNKRKIILAAASAVLIAGISSSAFAEGDIDGTETIFETDATTQIQPASSPVTQVETQPKTLAEEAFDLSAGR